MSDIPGNQRFPGISILSQSINIPGISNRNSEGKTLPSVLKPIFLYLSAFICCKRRGLKCHFRREILTFFQNNIYIILFYLNHQPNPLDLAYLPIHLSWFLWFSWLFLLLVYSHKYFFKKGEEPSPFTFSLLIIHQSLILGSPAANIYQTAVR